MERRNIVIDFPELPLRSRSLSDEEMGKILGGCQQKYAECQCDADCCNGMPCKNIGFNSKILWSGVCGEDRFGS